MKPVSAYLTCVFGGCAAVMSRSDSEPVRWSVYLNLQIGEESLY